MTTRTVEEGEEKVTYGTAFHEVTLKRSTIESWQSKVTGTHGIFLDILRSIQGRMRKVTKEIISGQMYQDSFNELWHEILKEELNCADPLMERIEYVLQQHQERVLEDLRMRREEAKKDESSTAQE